jgi:hypothetical protein
MRHHCIGDYCDYCAHLAERREMEREETWEGDWRDGQDAYERFLDRIGESA